MAFKRIIEMSSASDTEKISITDLFMSFEVEKTDVTTPNKATIKIYNLSKDTAVKFGKIKNTLTIKFGYEDESGAQIVFIGSINKSEYRKESTEKILEIEAFDGLSNSLEKNFDASYGENALDANILQDLIDNLGLPVASPIPKFTGNYSGGFAFIGKTIQALSKVVAKNKYQWTIQNNQLYFYKEGESYRDVAVQELLLTPNTGLLSISPVEQDAALTGGKKAFKGNYKIVSLIFPQLIPSSTVKIESADVSGRAVILSCKLTADNRDGDANAECEALALAPEPLPLQSGNLADTGNLA